MILSQRNFTTTLRQIKKKHSPPPPAGNSLRAGLGWSVGLSCFLGLPLPPGWMDCYLDESPEGCETVGLHEMHECRESLLLISAFHLQ